MTARAAVVSRCLIYFGFDKKQILVHDSYLINLGHPETEGLEKSRNAFSDYEKYSDMNIVVKPNSTNFGKGVSVIKKNCFDFH